MTETLFYIFSSFWAGAVHAATPGHGKTVAAAYIVGARGKPIDAVILGVFVTLSHTSGIVLVGVLAALGSAWLAPQRIEIYLARDRDSRHCARPLDAVGAARTDCTGHGRCDDDP
jgi:nickel/cobalt exporter